MVTAWLTCTIPARQLVRQPLGGPGEASQLCQTCTQQWHPPSARRGGPRCVPCSELRQQGPCPLRVRRAHASGGIGERAWGWRKGPLLELGEPLVLSASTVGSSEAAPRHASLTRPLAGTRQWGGSHEHWSGLRVPPRRVPRRSQE